MSKQDQSLGFHDKNDIFRLARKFFLEEDKTSHQLKKVNSDKHVLTKLEDMLKDPEQRKFISEKTGQVNVLGPNTIRKLIEQALKKYPVDLRIRESADWETMIQQFEESRDKLKCEYNLKELRVSSPFSDGNPEREGGAALSPGVSSNICGVGKEAARLFSDLVESHGKNPMVGIGGGRTMRQMAIHLECRGFPLTVTATNYATRICEDDVYDSSYLAMSVRWLYNNSRAKIISMPPMPSGDPKTAATWHSDLFKRNKDIARHFREGLDCDIVFVGTGNFHPQTPAISRVYQNLGIDYEALKKLNPVGDMNLCFYDNGGNDITQWIVKAELRKELPQLEETDGTFFPEEARCHPFLVGMNLQHLKNLVKEKKKTVVLVAGGEGAKTDAIFTALRFGMANALVTDAVTMEKLLADKYLSQLRKQR